MRINLNILLGFLVIAFSIAIGSALIAQAQNLSDISYPIPELGNCSSKEECKNYCDKSENILACIDFAREHNLMSEGEIQRADKFNNLLRQEGPGGCTDYESCEMYCEDLNHLEACLAFAEKHNILPRDELEEMRKMRKALAEGVEFPGGCSNREECDAYCDDPMHMEECIVFGEKAGFMSPKELEESKQALIAIKKGVKVPNCRSDEECDAYCSMEEHLQECIDFSVAAGFMDPEEAKMILKTGGKGPGGCKSKESCDAFCNNPENQEACFEFASEHGFVPEGELERIKQDMIRFKEEMKRMPEETVACLKKQLGVDLIGRIERGEFVPGPDMGKNIEICMKPFEEKMRGEIIRSLNEASPEVSGCLLNSLGQETLNSLKREGGMTPEIGEKMKKCFMIEQRKNAEDMRQFLANMGPMKECIRKGLGGEVFARVERGEVVEDLGPEVGDIFRNCSDDFQRQIPQIPDQAKHCLEQKYGGGSIFWEKLNQGGIDLARLRDEISFCLRESGPDYGNGGDGGDWNGGGDDFPIPEMPYIPDEIKYCLEKMYGSGEIFWEKMGQGEIDQSTLEKEMNQCWALEKDLLPIKDLPMPIFLPDKDIYPKESPAYDPEKADQNMREIESIMFSFPPEIQQCIKDALSLEFYDHISVEDIKRKAEECMRRGGN